jgi:hypothetical protein
MFQLLKALRGDSGIIECGFVASDVTEAKYFSTPLELGVGRLLASSKPFFHSRVFIPTCVYARKSSNPFEFYIVNEYTLNHRQN